ncbi:Leucine-rich repeat flightless-interacting protein [Halocaridina rubra]|uniref:Leucine-rich repeat flightless-interacting protein n=1 Tax=Halocaridina rubra TaxID=373956 RepID=A0AAN8ZTN2_HALRR
MSKLFKPMFKKKGKEREEDISIDEPKRKIVNEDGIKKKNGHEDGTRAKIRMKAEKMKDALRSPVKTSAPSLPSKAGKYTKKLKGKGKEKGSVIGELCVHSTEEAENLSMEDIYVDDDGTVTMGHLDQTTFVDDNLYHGNKRASDPFGEEDEENNSNSDDDEKLRNRQNCTVDLNLSISSEEEKLDSSEISQTSIPESVEQEPSFSEKELELQTKDAIEHIGEQEDQGLITEEQNCTDTTLTNKGDFQDSTGVSPEPNDNLIGDEDVSEKIESERTFTSTQDSDEDFDSAQEDWEDDDFGGSRKKQTPQDTLGEIMEGEQSSVVNAILTEGVVKSPSTGSSEYEDILSLQESSHLGETSDEYSQTAIGNQSKIGEISCSEKQVRKLSELSTASGDAFNEELDDLLDEELDRLSERDEADIEKTENEGKPKEEVNFEVPASMQKDSLEVQSCEVNENPDKEKVDKIVGSSLLTQDAKVENLPVPDSDSLPLKNIEDTGSTDKISCTAGGPLLSEEQVKDSGYYSLPVSPKPGTVVRVNDGDGQGAIVVDDISGDSEDDGLITPAGEAPAEEKTESVKDETDFVAVDEKTGNHDDNALEKYKDCDPCCIQPAEPKEAPVIEDKSNTEAVVVLSEDNSNKPCPKQDVNLKVTIPKFSQLEKKDEVLSPKCGSPTKSRYKSPLKEMDDPFSSDPVGDRFLKEAVLQSHEEAEARLAQRRAARAEARELRLRELEKQQQDQENEEEKQFTSPSYAEPSPRAPVASRTSLGRTGALNSTGQYSRRSSEDSTTDESALPANVREMRAEFKELDEKFRKAMITNAQLDNEKSTLTYEVELIKDKYTELEESHTQLNKEHRRKCTEYEQLKKVSTKLQEEVKILRGMLQERDQLIQEYGLVVVGEEEENGEVPPEPDEFDDMDDLTPRKIAVKKVLLSQEAAELLEKGAAKGSLDVRLKKFGEEKNDLEDQVRRLKLELEEERNNNRRRENGLDYEKQKEQSKTVNEYKFRVQKAEAEVLTLQANVARLDALSTRYKTQSEELEKSEEELKVEKRKLQRELRDAQSRLEELETTNNHLIRRFDKLKNARSTLLKDLSQDPA